MRSRARPTEPFALADTDVRNIVRLLGETCALEGSVNDRKFFLLNGLCRLINATHWTWGLTVRLSPDSLPQWMVQLHGGFDEASLARFLLAQEHPDMTALTAPFASLVQQRGDHVTRIRQQTDPEDRFRQSGAYQLWLEAGVVPGILSCRPLGPDTASAISIHRPPEAPLFTERESRIAHIVLTEIPWLHLPAETATSSPDLLAQLSPRRHTVFNLLILGQTRQAIADHLGISIHTANGYVKDIFRHFNVQSQIQLIQRFSQGNGGDT